MIVGTGIDVVHISRVSRLLNEHADHLGQVFTDRERTFCERGPTRHRAARYAMAFAGKEAVMKALATGWRADVGFRDIETRDPACPREAVLHGRLREVAAQLGIGRLLLSDAWTADVAVASVIGTERQS